MGVIKIEQYLLDQYGVIEDKYLTNEYEIEKYFKSSNSHDYFDCGQGYAEEEITLICKINDKFYEVELIAEIGSSKQDRGDRLYWVDRIDSVNYREIPKPKMKSIDGYTIKASMTENEKIMAVRFFDELNVSYTICQTESD